MQNAIVQKRRVKVQVRDPETDAVLEERIVDNDYVVVCTGDRYIKSMQVWGATHQLNIAREKPRFDVEPVPPLNDSLGASYRHPDGTITYTPEKF